jgi:hypothetical protein
MKSCWKQSMKEKMCIRFVEDDDPDAYAAGPFFKKSNRNRKGSGS